MGGFQRERKMKFILLVLLFNKKDKKLDFKRIQRRVVFDRV